MPLVVVPTLECTTLVALSMIKLEIGLFTMTRNQVKSLGLVWRKFWKPYRKQDMRARFGSAATALTQVHGFLR